MARSKRSGGRAPNGASSVYLGGDGRWHGRVTVGVKDDGSPDRRHVNRKTEAEVIAAVRRLEQARETDTVQKAGRAMPVEAWLRHWLENIARPSVKYKSYRAYQTAVDRHLVPGLGQHRLDKVGPEHFEKLYSRMLAAGSRPGTAAPGPPHGSDRVRRGATTWSHHTQSCSPREGAARRGGRGRPVRDRRDPAAHHRSAQPTQRRPIRAGPRDRNPAGRDNRSQVGPLQPGDAPAPDRSTAPAPDLAARLQRPARTRAALPQGEAVPFRLQAARPRLPAALRRRLHEPCPVVPAATRRRPGRRRRQVASWPPRHRPTGPARRAP